MAQQCKYELIQIPNQIKLSVVWRMIDSAIMEEAQEIAPRNAALSKTFPLVHKAKCAKGLDGVVDGKYIKFPDGSQARY